MDREDLRYAHSCITEAALQAARLRDLVEPLENPELYGALTHVIESAGGADPLIDKMRAAVTVAHFKA